MLRLILTAALILPTAALAEKKDKTDSPKPVTKHANVTIDGKKIPYTVTASQLTLKKDDGSPRATIFNVSYLRKEVKDHSKRPVLFAFNGGPGSSAVWLHLGALGPRIAPSSPDGTQPLTPPITTMENPHSILDVTDLVFIDPVTTGFSRKSKDNKNDNFHSLNGDIESVGDFIRRWISENKRWHSPKYILGESYGGVRAAGLSTHLQSEYGMQLNGVVLLSSLLDFRTLRPSSGNDLTYQIYLPTYTATAHHHGVIQGDRDQLVAEATVFANGPYALALLKGYTLSDKEKQDIAAKLSKFTGIPEQDILDRHLRIHPSFFRSQLLKQQKKVVGRFDSRVAWPTTETNAWSDPSFDVVKGPISTAMLDYLTRDLSWEDDRVYRILTSKVHPWKWGTSNNFVNLSEDLEKAMRSNPKLRVLVQCGHTDLATPAGGILHSLNHLRIPDTQRNNLSVEWYEAGHMFYLNQPDLEKMRKDLVEFITQ